MNQGINQIAKSLGDMIDYLKVAPIDTISGKGDREFSTASIYSPSYAGELTVRLPEGYRLELSHVMDPGCPGVPGISDGKAPWKQPTAFLARENLDRRVPLNDSESRKIHQAVGSRIGYQREDAEQRIALMNAEVLLNPEKVSWVRCEGSKGEEVFRTQLGNVTMWLSHTVTSFFGFKREKYQLVGCFSCDLYDADSRYTDERARILFQKVSNGLQKPKEDINRCPLPNYID